MSTTPADISVRDKLHRPVRDLRVSVTDRCNFRCVYCMPKDVFNRDYPFAPRAELLQFDEICAAVRAFVHHGVQKVRITGGEPMLRPRLEQLVADLARIDGLSDLSMTTNASLMTQARARSLHDAGLHRLNVSLDTLDEQNFKRVSDVGYSLSRVLDGIEAAGSVFDSIKVNMVVKRGMNEQDILPMARYFHGSGHVLRFIEFMDVGMTNGWGRGAVVSAREIIEQLRGEFELESLEPQYRGEVAKRWRYCDGGGEIGLVTSVSEPFCDDCARARLSAIGHVYTCLFAAEGHDIRPLLRPLDADKLSDRIGAIWSARADRYSQMRALYTYPLKRVEMSRIGG